MAAIDKLKRVLHPKITIIVEGGVVQEVMSNNPNIQVTLIDYDNEPDSTTGKEKRFTEILGKTPYMIKIN